ncbi:hypothetical protein [Kineococcus esterisolvens]|uniref:hypothetical protein n=1 Tax=unclassified Kineococcus TaxID=2621656 RepID=UPI003D7E0385
MEGLQEVLGEHQDSVVVREVLHRLDGRDPGALAFTCGRLFAAEVGRAAAGREAVGAAREAASATELRRWLHRGQGVRAACRGARQGVWTPRTSCSTASAASRPPCTPSSTVATTRP